MAVFTAVLFGCIAPVVCSIDYATDGRGLFYVSLPCPGVHPHGSRVVAHLQPLCWGFFSSFEVTWSGVRPVLNVSFVFCGFTLWLSWSSCADSMAGCLRKSRESYLGYAVQALKGSSFFLNETGRSGLLWDWLSQVVQLLSCFCRRGGRLPCSSLGQRVLFQTRGPVALSGQVKELLQTRGPVALQ